MPSGSCRGGDAIFEVENSGWIREEQPLYSIYRSILVPKYVDVELGAEVQPVIHELELQFVVAAYRALPISRMWKAIDSHLVKPEMQFFCAGIGQTVIDGLLGGNLCK